MNKNVILVWVIAGLIYSTTAEATHQAVSLGGKNDGLQKHWSCYTSADAQARKKQVTNDILPQLVFDGETQAVDIETRMAESKLPALSVAVIHQGKLDWSAAWGQLQTGGSDADCSSLFQAGSIAKPATLLAVLRMRSTGLIDLDRNIETYLSSYQLPQGQQTQANPVNFRNLLAHTSGVVRGGYAGYAQNEPIPTDQQIVRGEVPSNSPQVEVVNPPGASLAYSGGGYTVAEIALQDHLQKPFDQLMHEWLIEPADMKQASFTMPLPEISHPHTARGHQIDGSIITGGWNNYPEQAAAGLWATATDLAVLLLEIHRGYEGKSKLLTQASIHEMLANPIANHVYGFRLVGQGDQIFITHYGGTVGYSAGITLNLQSGNGAVFLANSRNGANLGEEFFSAVSRTYEWPVFRERKVKRLKQPAEVLQSLAGTYVFQGWKVMVLHKNDSLTLLFPAGNRLPLVMLPIQSDSLKFAHETGVIADFVIEGKDAKIHLFGQTGLRQTDVD